MTNRFLIYNNLLKQLREREKKLVLLRNLFRQLESGGKPVDRAKRNLTVLMDEMRNLQNKIREYHPLGKMA
jgi:hypothetical protein